MMKGRVAKDIRDSDRDKNRGYVTLYTIFTINKKEANQNIPIHKKGFVPKILPINSESNGLEISQYCFDLQRQH